MVTTSESATNIQRDINDGDAVHTVLTFFCRIRTHIDV